MKKIYLFLVLVIFSCGIAYAQCTGNITSFTDVSCFGGNDGGVCVTPGGGTGPYSYSWSNGAITPCLNDCVAGICTVTVTDAMGCSAPLSVIPIRYL